MKRFLIPLVLVLIHAALVVFVGAEIALSPDPAETEMAWLLFLFIDFPMSLCYPALWDGFSPVMIALPILLIGTIQWGIVGFLLQKAVAWFRRRKKGAKHGDQ